MTRLPLYGALMIAGAAAFWGWSERQYDRGWNDGRAAMELTMYRAIQETQERLGNADLGHGDEIDDWCRVAHWLQLDNPTFPGDGTPCP